MKILKVIGVDGKSEDYNFGDIHNLATELNGYLKNLKGRKIIRIDTFLRGNKYDALIFIGDE